MKVSCNPIGFPPVCEKPTFHELNVYEIKLAKTLGLNTALLGERNSKLCKLWQLTKDGKKLIKVSTKLTYSEKKMHRLVSSCFKKWLPANKLEHRTCRVLHCAFEISSYNLKNSWQKKSKSGRSEDLRNFFKITILYDNGNLRISFFKKVAMKSVALLSNKR